MPAYVIGQLDIHDPEAYEAYLVSFLPSFERHGGELLATSWAETEVLGGDWALPRTVVMRLPSVEAAKAWHSDPDYVAVAEIRHGMARTNLVFIEGLRVRLLDGSGDPARPAGRGPKEDAAAPHKAGHRSPALSRQFDLGERGTHQPGASGRLGSARR